MGAHRPAACPVCGKKIQGQTIAAMVAQLLSLKPGTKLVLLAPFIKDKKASIRLFLNKSKRRLCPRPRRRHHDGFKRGLPS